MKMSVWAPNAQQRVDIETQVGRFALEPHARGWWSIELPLPAGTDYVYHLDGGPALPDPRSPWQPEGPHGPSRTVDHAAFPWTDGAWQAPPLGSAVIYELHVGTFTPQGTFESAIDRLAHLVDLGATHVELMPVAEFVGTRGWGYDGVDLYAPFHHYGGPEGLKRLVDACHAAGLAVLLDVVYNHLGPTGNYLSQFGPYFSQRHHTAWGAALNFDGPASDEVRRFLCDNALAWLRDYHFDGLRIDAVHAIVDTSAIPFLEQLGAEIRQLATHLGRRLVAVAESDLNDPRLVRPRLAGGFELDAQWADDMHHALHAVLTGENQGYYSDFGSMADLALALRRPYVYAGRYSEFRRRSHGRTPDGLDGDRFVTFLQNHDQIGNRAQGDRIEHLAGTARARIGSALAILSPYVPLLFQGEEWDSSAPFQYFVDFSAEPELARAVTEGRRREFAEFRWRAEEIPDPQSPETFARSKLDWSELAESPHREALQWHRALVRLRRALPDLTDARLERVRTLFDEQGRWLMVLRGAVTIVCNFHQAEQVLPLRAGQPQHVLLSWPAGITTGPSAIRMPGDSVAILGRDDPPCCD